MKYALINGQRSEAIEGANAICPTCGGKVIAKCGSFRIHHWSHKGLKDCDSWAEKETPWHRAWKNNFSPECQEIVQFNKVSGEKHIADVRTKHGLVIEFQHSHLDPKERQAREDFYKNMVWVVDCTRIQRDYPRLESGKSLLDWLGNIDGIGFFRSSTPENCFPSLWLESGVPVVFDFLGNDLSDEIKDDLWCIIPGQAAGFTLGAVIPRCQFIDSISSRLEWFPSEKLLKLVNTIQQKPLNQLQIKNHYSKKYQILNRLPKRRLPRF